MSLLNPPIFFSSSKYQLFCKRNLSNCHCLQCKSTNLLLCMLFLFLFIINKCIYIRKLVFIFYKPFNWSCVNNSSAVWDHKNLNSKFWDEIQDYVPEVPANREKRPWSSLGSTNRVNCSVTGSVILIVGKWRQYKVNLLWFPIWRCWLGSRMKSTLLFLLSIRKYLHSPLWTCNQQHQAVKKLSRKKSLQSLFWCNMMSFIPT